jgi:uncharacterized membrane protein SirB2
MRAQRGNQLLRQSIAIAPGSHCTWFVASKFAKLYHNMIYQLYSRQPGENFHAGTVGDIKKSMRMPTSYILLKCLRVSCVALSGAGFVPRGGWMILDSPMLARRWVRISPHVLDTVLLASAIALALLLGQYPLVDAWLTAKVLGLAAYIVLGTIALRRGCTRAVRIAAFWGALLVFAYIVAVAMTKSVLPYVG